MWQVEKNIFSRPAFVLTELVSETIKYSGKNFAPGDVFFDGYEYRTNVRRLLLGKVKFKIGYF